MIRTLIVDDEALARDGIRALLSDEVDFEVQGEAGDGPQAVRVIEALRPDLVLLDVQIPGFDGFDVLKRVAHVHLPAVIFVTAHDEYACQAFDTQAIDYLLKPISEARFQQALQRVRRELAHDEDLAEAQNRLVALLEAYSERGIARQERSRWFTVKAGQSYRVLQSDEIAWIGSALNYVELHTKERSYLMRMTMNQLEERLEPNAFVRIHRSAIVNLTCVDAIDQTAHGEFIVKLKDGTALPLGRHYRHRLLT